VHEHRVWKGASIIAFPGNLQGRHIRETGPRGALMVTAHGAEIESVERLTTDVLRWHALAVDVSHASGLADAVRAVGQSLEELLRNAESDRPMAIRVTLSGATAAHGHLFGLDAQLRAEVLAQAASLSAERLWIEKVKVETSPLVRAKDISARSDAVADLQVLLARAGSDEAFLQGLQEDLMLLVGKVPLEVISAVPQLEEVRAGRMRALVDGIAPSVIAHVAKAG